jgi:DNA transformation protein and related proteins
MPGMATSEDTVLYITDQLIDVAHVQTRKMFGEYALYVDTKVVALICDDTLFVKITEPGKAFAGTHYHEGTPYPGAKPYMKISEEFIEDRRWLTKLVLITEEATPLPIPKKHPRVSRARSKL